LNYPYVKSLANAVLKIRENYEYYSKNARESIKRQFTLEKMVNQYIRIIEGIISNK